jgi:SAM-dependent methyltransferase
MSPVSPLTGSDRLELIDLIPVEKLIALYRNNYQIDVSQIFTGIHQVRVFRCQDTGYRFYYPFQLAGDASFQAQFARFGWLANRPNWEYEASLAYIQPTDRVLEIGAKHGHFIKLLTEKGIAAQGLASGGAAPAPGQSILTEDIDTHAAQHPEAYDVVCAFQVLANLSSVKDFIRPALKVLRKGGRLLLGVPNNHGYLGRATDDPLNMPPHTMGLWDEHALRAVAWVFSELYVEKIVVQPLQPEHDKMYYKTYVATVNEGWPGKIFSQITFPLVRPLIRARANRIRGRSVLAVYTKK